MPEADELKTGASEGSAGADGGADGGNTEAGSGTGSEAAKSVEFSPKQQAKVQEIVDGAYKKAFAKAKEESTKITANEDEVAKLKAELAEAADLKAKQPSPDVDEMKKKIAELEKTNTGLEANKTQNDSLRKSEMLLTAISKFTSRGIGEIAQLIRDTVTIGEDGQPQIQGKDGAPKLNAKGEQMTLDEYIASWLAERPHYLEAAGGTGAGSKGAKFGEGDNKSIRLETPADVQAMEMDDLHLAIKNGGITIIGERGQEMKFKTVSNVFADNKRRKAKAAAAGQ